MPCESSLLQPKNNNCNNNTRTTTKSFDSWPIKKYNNNSGAPPSSSVNFKATSSSNNNYTGTKTVPELSFKTSDSTEAKSITPDKDHDVTMNEVNEGDAAATAKAPAAAAASSDNGGSSTESGAVGGVAVASGGEDTKNNNGGSNGDAAAAASSSSDSEGENSNKDDDGEKEDVEMEDANDDGSSSAGEEGKAKPEATDDSGDDDEGEDGEGDNADNKSKDAEMEDANDDGSSSAGEEGKAKPEATDDSGDDDDDEGEDGGDDNAGTKSKDAEMEDANDDGSSSAGEEGKAKPEATDDSGDDDEGEGGEDDNADTKSKDADENKSEESKAEEAGEDEENKKNGNNDDQTLDDAPKKEEGGEEEKAAAPAAPAAPLPLLVGTLAYSDRDNLRRHIIRGNWTYDGSLAVTPQPFELIRTIPPEEELEELPKDGEFNGSFNVQHAMKTSKGKIKMKNRAVSESGVKLTFKPKEGEEGKFEVNGTGMNEYGTFKLFGTATKNTKVEEGDQTYSVSVHKEYITFTPVPTVAKEDKKDKKRKLADASGDDEEKPPPTELPTEGICLRGKLVRNTSDELSLDNAAVHRITGLWAMKMSKIVEEPDTCEKFEYEHKCSGDSTVFPLSGRYTGFFYVNDAGQRTKVAERDVTLKFRLNNEGYHNVDGRGSNVFGKYSITGTLTKEGVITLFRHFQAPKLKASKKSSQVKIAAPLNGSSGGSKLPTKANDAISSSSLLTFEDVNAPDEADGPPAPLTPPEQFSAISRGILKIENDGTHSCTGSWALTNDHFQTGMTSKYHFGITSNVATENAKAMLERFKASGLDKDDDRQIKNLTSDGVSPVTLANSTFPIDSTEYKGSFKLRKGPTRTQTIVDKQLVLKYVKNTGGSYNVYGKGTNEMGTFDLVGTLILQGRSNGLLQLYRLYPKIQEPIPTAKASSRKSGKMFTTPGLTEKAPVNSGPVPAMKPPERFIPSMSGLQRRESSRMSRLPSRLEEDDPQAQMDRLMEKCRQILKELQEADVQKIFGVPVDPIALGIPTYFDVIKNPMDLGTIQTKMDNDEIDSPEEFARLVRLTFENAITFNTMPDNLVNVTARSMLGLFAKKFGTIDKAFNAAKKNKKLTKAERQELKRKEKEAAKEAKRKAKEEKERKRKAEVEASNESKRMKLENVLAANKSTMAAIAQAAPKDPNAEVSRAEYNLLLQAIKQVQEQIVSLHKLVKKSSKGTTASSSSTANKVGSHVSSAHVSSYTPAASTFEPSKPKKKKMKKEPEPSPPPSPKAPSPAPVEEELQPLTFEEQEALSEAINLLPDHLLPGAMQIIRESEFVNDDDEEIDLDIDQLDNKTQRKLQSFVMENVKTKKKKKKQPKKPAKAATPAPAAPPSPEPSPKEEEKPSSSARQPGGKSFGGFGFPDDDDDSDDDKEEEEEEDLNADFGNWVANPPTQDATDEKEASEDSNKDEGDDLWGEAREAAEAAKAREADRAEREKKRLAEAEAASQKRLAEAAALGEKARAEREQKEAEEKRLQEEKEREEEQAREEARRKALEEVNNVDTGNVDLGDDQRILMEQYEQEFNDNYSAGASPSSDFGF